MLRAMWIGFFLASLAVSTALGEEEGEKTQDIKAFLEEARGKYNDQTMKGLKSFSARVFLKFTSDPKIQKSMDILDFNYAWTAPDKDEFSFNPKLPKGTQTGMRVLMEKLWIYLSGAVVFPLLENAENPKLETGEGKTMISGKFGQYGDSRVTFDSETHEITEWTFLQNKARIVFEYEKKEGGLRVVAWVSEKEGKGGRTVYKGFRKVSKLLLPTAFDMKLEKNSYQFGVEYLTINERPAKLAAIDNKEVKEKVKEFEKGWKKWGVEEKIEKMQALSEIDHDLVSAAIAKWGLRDRSMEVRKAAAKILGLMKRRNVTLTLISAMKRNEKDITVYLTIIRALGELNDPRAVKSLSTDWWNQRIGEYGTAAAKAKIDALGNIRHATSVDGLIDIFYLTRDATISQFKQNIVKALMKLTGQNFLYDRKAWKNWWKRNRATHRFK